MISEPLILSLETATPAGSICLAHGPKILAARDGDAGVSHSNSLINDIEECLHDAGLKISDVDVFACASGPGSFTGLRIGIATLKALAATLRRPCIGVPTLNAVAHSAGPSPATIALLPAGRGEVFAQMFSVSESDEVVALDRPVHLSPAKAVERYRSHANLLWAGAGAHQHNQILIGVAASNGKVAGGADAAEVRNWRLAPLVTSLARNVSLLAVKMFAAGEVQNAENLKAIYVRPSDAEINQACQ